MAPSKTRNCPAFHCILERSSWKAERAQYLFLRISALLKGQQEPAFLSDFLSDYWYPCSPKETHTHSTMLIIRICTSNSKVNLAPSLCVTHTAETHSPNCAVSSFTLTCSEAAPELLQTLCRDLPQEIPRIRFAERSDSQIYAQYRNLPSQLKQGLFLKSSSNLNESANT